MELAVIVLLVAVPVVVLGGLFVFESRRTWIRRRSGRRVVAHLTDDRSLEGTLVVTARDGIVLRGARYLEESEPTPLAGEIYVPRERVSFVQLP